ncbi:MAG: phosphohydrolase [Desulfobacterium sp.]|nr:phosphohydrolase [Desulfobacterium sp.]
MTKPDAKIVEKIKKDIQLLFRHTDFKHEAIRELANLYFQREVSKQTNNMQNAASARIIPESEEVDEGSYHPVDLDTLLRTQIKLPSLPTIFNQIMELMTDPDSSAHDFSNVISNDPALTARLLKIVNTAFYGYRSQIDTISHAVMIIGTSELYALCLSTSILALFKDIPSILVDMTSFWKHSIGCGMMARKIAARKGETNRERFFVAGLLHDIGRLVIYNNLPNQAHQAISYTTYHKDLLYNAETRVLGFDHTRIGGRILDKWKLPGKLADVIRFHHHPEDSPEPFDTAIIHLSDIMMNALKLGTSGEQFVPPLSPVAWKMIGLPVEMLSEIIQETVSQIEEISSILIPRKQDNQSHRYY